MIAKFVLALCFRAVCCYNGTLFLEKYFEQRLNTTSDIHLYAHNIFTRSFNDEKDPVYPQAVQMYFYPAKIVHIETPYEHIISDDKHNSIVYSLEGINTTHMGSIAYLMDSSTNSQFQLQQFLDNSRMEFLNFTEFSTYEINFKDSADVILRNETLPDRQNCLISYQAYTQMNDFVTIRNFILRKHPTQHIDLLQHDAENGWVRSTTDSSFTSLNSTCNNIPLDVASALKNLPSFNISHTIDAEVTLDNGQTYIVEFQAKFESHTCESLLSNTTNIYEQPILNILENILFTSVVSQGNIVNATDLNGTCYYKMLSTYDLKEQALLGYQHLQRIPKIDYSYSVDFINVYSVPEFTFSISANDINSGNEVQTASCDYTIDVNIFQPPTPPPP